MLATGAQVYLFASCWLAGIALAVDRQDLDNVIESMGAGKLAAFSDGGDTQSNDTNSDNNYNSYHSDGLLAARNRANIGIQIAGASGEPSQANQLLELANRVLLMEKLVANCSAKLHETEERLRQLEKCECRKSCRWTSRADSTSELKLEGESWNNECDVCSCHQGQVRCRHVTCPSVNCSDPHHVAGKCCPVCYKSCAYKAQTFAHGNKLVINGVGETCKECVCLDGRFKCQRALTPNGERVRRHAQTDERAESSSAGREPDSWSEAPADKDDQDETLEEEEQFQAEPELELDSERARTKRSHPPIVCPNVDCAPEARSKLDDHCCVYCNTTDFCAQTTNRCHPNATCTSLGNNTAIAKNIQQLFSCACKPGFVGDGLSQCQDVDECAVANASQPVCDLATTNCVNLEGDFECTCKEGFKRPPLLGRESSSKAPCRDINECLDGKLNRCHTNARCINLAGSYKCFCKRGYIGNGFKCRKWFSSLPHSAAYLHAHSPNSPQHQQHLHSMEPLPEEETDQSSAASSSDYDAETSTDDQYMKLSGSTTSQQRQQSASDLGQQTQERALPEPSALNTRTMFFQPPPLSTKKPLTTTTITDYDSSSNNSPNYQTTTASISQSSSSSRRDQQQQHHNDHHRHSSKLSSASSSNQNGDIKQSLKQTSSELSSGSTSYANSRQQQSLASVFSLTNSDGQNSRQENSNGLNGSQSHKKGSIIASATTSSTHTSKASWHQHKSRASNLGTLSPMHLKPNLVVVILTATLSVIVHKLNSVSSILTCRSQANST